MADIAASVLEKLKNKAKASGISYQQCLQLFFQEEFLRKLAASKYKDNLILIDESQRKLIEEQVKYSVCLAKSGKET